MSSPTSPTPYALDARRPPPGRAAGGPGAAGAPGPSDRLGGPGTPGAPGGPGTFGEPTGAGMASAGSAPTVRRVTAGDAARMRALRLEMLADSPLAFLETVAEAASRPHAEYAARIAGSATGSERGQFVAAHGARFVGHAGGVAAQHDPALTMIFAVYLTPAWRGSGLLADLIAAVAAWSRACGRPELLLEVVVGNNRAVRAYERLGFVDTGVRVPHPTVAELTELQMRRPA